MQTLAQTCQGFAAGMVKFCEAMDWGAMAATLDHFADRLKAGARADLLGLSKITFVKSRTARVFWDNGFKTVAVVANADPQELVPVLMQAQPNKVRLEAKDEQKYMDKLLAKAKIITDSANRIWREYMIPLCRLCMSMGANEVVLCHRNRDATGVNDGRGIRGPRFFDSYSGRARHAAQLGTAVSSCRMITRARLFCPNSNINTRASRCQHMPQHNTLGRHTLGHWFNVTEMAPSL